MSNRLSEEKAQAIATEYCTNGFKKVLALVSVGYKQSYANCKRGLSLYDNVKVKTAIAKIRTATIAKTWFSVAQAQAMYEEDRQFAKKSNQAGAMVSATTGICRLYGMDKDAGGGEKTVIVISPRIIPILPKLIDSKEI